MTNASLDGLLTGLSLIVAIGAQNAFLLRQGLRQVRVGAVVAICTLSDLVLIVAGVSGIGAVIAHAGWALVLVRWIGVAFLTWYGLSSVSRASVSRARGRSALTAARDDSRSERAVVRRAFAFTWLNPHVYLDTVILLGSVANAHGPSGRWWFAAGAGTASALWFTGLGFGARLAAPLLATARAWQILDLLIGVTMVLLAVKLAVA
jgi:L-lysine exporter family protein LysE/ArgO